MILTRLVLKNPSKYIQTVYLFQSGYLFFSNNPTCWNEKIMTLQWRYKDVKIAADLNTSKRILIKNLRSKCKIIKLSHNIASKLFSINIRNKNDAIYLEFKSE